MAARARSDGQHLRPLRAGAGLRAALHDRRSDSTGDCRCYRATRRSAFRRRSALSSRVLRRCKGIYRTRLAAVLIAALGMSVTTFVGALAAHSTPGARRGDRGRRVCLCARSGKSVPSRRPSHSTHSSLSCSFRVSRSAPTGAATDSALVFAGGLVQAALVLLAWPTARRGVERSALANVYHKLAAYARAVAAGEPALPPFTPLATARQVLADPQPFASAARWPDRTACSRIRRSSGSSLERWRRRSARVQARTQRERRPPRQRTTSITSRKFEPAKNRRAHPKARGTSPNICATRAKRRRCLRSGAFRDLRSLEAASRALRSKSHRLARPRLDTLRDRADDRDGLGAALRGRSRILDSADRGDRAQAGLSNDLLPRLRARSAARCSARSSPAASLRCCGDIPRWKSTGILIAAAAAYLTFNPNYALFTVAITSFVVLVLAMRGLPGTTAIDRAAARYAGRRSARNDRLRGAAFMGTHGRTRALLADLLDAQRRLAGAILRAYANPSNGDRSAIEAARTQLWKVRTAVEASIDRTRQEPQRRHSIGAGRALRILAATQRFALASLALESALAPQRTAALPWLSELTEALDADITELASALRQSRRAAAKSPPSRAAEAVETRDGPQA